MAINSEANQHARDPREQICWDFYIEGVAKGQPNAKGSALKAGYSEPHADNITLQGWFKGRLKDLERKDMLSKAELKLSRTLDYNVEREDGEIKVDLLRVQVDVSKHLTETIGKEIYSKRNELTGKDGENLIPQPLLGGQSNVQSNDSNTETIEPTEKS